MGSHEPAVSYWNQSAGRIWALLSVWVFLNFAILLFVPDARASNIFGVPTAHWLIVQGCAIAVVAAYRAGRRTNRT